MLIMRNGLLMQKLVYKVGPNNSPAARDDAAWVTRNDKPTIPEFSARPGIPVQPADDATAYWFLNLYFVHVL